MTSQPNGRREGKKNKMSTAMQKHECQAKRKNRESLGNVREIVEKALDSDRKTCAKKPKEMREGEEREKEYD